MHEKRRATIVVGVAILLTVGTLFVLGRPRCRAHPSIATGSQVYQLYQWCGRPFCRDIPCGFNEAARVQHWLAAGTNVALFSITNRQRCPIILYPYTDFHKTNSSQARYQTFLLNPPTAYGILLQPGQAVVVEVAVLPGEGPGRVRIGYSRDYYHFFPRMQEELRGLIQRKRPDFHSEWFYSDWFER